MSAEPEVSFQVLVPGKGGLRIHHQLQEYKETVVNKASSTAQGIYGSVTNVLSRMGLAASASTAAPASALPLSPSKSGSTGSMAGASPPLSPGATPPLDLLLGPSEGPSEETTDASLDPDGTGPSLPGDKEQVHYIWRLTEGPERPLPDGGRDKNSVAGRVDFCIQDSLLVPQYLSAPDAHFLYWKEGDLALFLLRACTGRNIMTGEPKGASAAQQGDKAVPPPGPAAAPPTQHKVAGILGALPRLASRTSTTADTTTPS